MEPPSTETVYQAVYTLYKNVDTTEQEKASAWLENVQRSIHSWKIADELLHEKRDLESCYFAAQTMRSKIQHSFHELPVEAQDSLRLSLFEHIKKITPETNTVIVTQLCLALADLALQMTSWSNFVEELICELSGASSWALLEILTVLPEEVNSRILKLGANRRNDIKQELVANSNKVVEFIKINQENSVTLIKSIKCLNSWISIKAIHLATIPENVTIAQCFLILGDHNAVNTLHEAATDCVCALLRCVEEDTSNELIERLIFSSVVALENHYHFAIAKEDQEKAFNYSRIFTELAESFLDKIINGCNGKGQTHFAFNVLDLVLMCVGHHDYEIAEISFCMWYRLSEELYQKANDELTNVFKPHIERLIAALCRHCQMDPDYQGVLEEGDDFYDFRMKVVDLIKDIVFIVGSSTCFKQMFLSLQVPAVGWEQTEAPLFIMQAVAKTILPDEYEVVPKVVEAILAMPMEAHPAVRRTCIQLLGELGEWIDEHPECLQSTLECLLRGLQDSNLATPAAQALQSVCTACRDHMAVHLSGLLHIVHSLESFRLSSEAALGLLRGVAATIGRLPQEQVTIAMRDACSVQLVPLAALTTLEAVNGAHSRNTPSDPVLWLDRIAALFRYIGTETPANGIQHPCLPALSDCWPVLSAAMDRYSKDGRVMERLCRCLRFALRCVGSQAAPLLQPLVSKMVVAYASYEHSCFLYLGSILVHEFATEESCLGGLTEMLSAFIEPTFRLLQEADGLRHHPDTVDDLFRLCVRFLQRAPQSFVESPVLPAIVQCALSALALDHRDANSSVTGFFTDLIHRGKSKSSPPAVNEKCTAIITQHGESLVNNLIQASVFSLQARMLSNVADVVLELSLWNRLLYDEWLKMALQRLPQNPASATPDQISEFHKLIRQPDSSKQVTQALKDFARLYY